MSRSVAMAARKVLPPARLAQRTQSAGFGAVWAPSKKVKMR
jgi:hypothetical protein